MTPLPPPAEDPESAQLQREAVAYQRIVPGDCFANSQCVTCEYHAALFVIAAGPYYGRLVRLCPLCVSHRIQQFCQEVDVLPAWVAWLQGEAKRAVAGQAKRDGRTPEFVWNNFYKTASCGRLVVYEDARWFVPPGETSSPAYCPTCIGSVRGDGKDVGRWLG